MAPEREFVSLPPLTDRQVELMRFIYRYWLQHRYSPTQREMCKALGIKSTNASPYLEALEKKGYLRRRPGHRNIQITEQGIEKLGLLGVIDENQASLFGETGTGE